MVRAARRSVWLVLLGVLLASGGVSQAAFVTPVNAWSTSYWARDGVHTLDLINSSGLSVNSPAGTHDNHLTAATMWITGFADGGLGGPIGGFPSPPPPVASQAVVFDLGRAYDLTGTYVWNQNQKHPTAGNLYLSRGTKDFDIYVSSDTDPLTATWTSMGSKTLNVAGGTPAEPAQWAPFAASGARLVKFDIQTAHSGAASEWVGLSEVRFDGLRSDQPAASVLLRDEFDALTGNTYDVNVDITRQMGSLAPKPYLQQGGPTNYRHQLQNPNARNQLLVADAGGGGSGAVAPDFNFNQQYSAGGLRISFDIDPQPANYPTREPTYWGAINLGASPTDVLDWVLDGGARFSAGFRGNGRMFASDGSTLLTGTDLNKEPIYTSSPGPGMKHIEILLSGVGDDNPFDGVGDTLIEVFGDVNGFSTPVYAYTKIGGYADNYVGLEGYGIAVHLDNFQIEQPSQFVVIPEPATFAIWSLGLLGLGFCGRRRRPRC